MTAVPSQLEYVFTVQDAHGDTAVVKMPQWIPDISAEAGTLGAFYTQAQALATALAACLNGKIVEIGMTQHWSRAQKPTGPLPTYAHVYQAGFLEMGDGGNERTRISMPTPKTTDFLTDGITVNPADTNVAALITAVEATCTSKANSPFNEYLGGRFREGKPRRRVNLYNATA